MSVNLSVAIERLRVLEEPLQFEHYALAVLSILEQTPVLSTARSWDKGRDGKSINNTGLYAGITLEKKRLASKAKADLSKLINTTSDIKKYYYCSNQDLSESAIDKLEKELLKQSPKFPVKVITSRMLADYDNKNAILSSGPTEYERHFGPNASNTNGEAEADRERLRLALMSVGGQDTAAIRTALYKTIILSALGDGRSRTLSDLARDVSNRLGLGRTLLPSTIEPNIPDLLDNQLITQTGAAIALSAKGRVALAELTKDGQTRLAGGRATIKKQLESGLGRQLSTGEFDTLWKAIETGITELLHERGQLVLAAVSSLVETAPNKVSKHSNSDYLSTVEGLSDAASKTWSNSESRKEIKQAVFDLFTDPLGSAAEWLVEVCANFVGLCTLGIEIQSAQAIRAALRNTELCLDTDVVISLLCEGEANHADIRTALGEWTKLGGAISVIDAVLPEVAHHAWISQRDFDNIKALLPSSEHEASSLIRNAFARAFAFLVREKKARAAHWSSFIKQFRGEDSTDYQPLLPHFRELGVRIRRARASTTSQLALKARARLRDAMQRRDPDVPAKTREDKTDRDASIIATLEHIRKKQREDGKGPACCLVSSSDRLARLPPVVQSGDELPWLISPAVWLSLVSLAPNAHIGLSALRSYLFDDCVAARPREFEQLVLRTVRAAGQYDIPWAKRATLFEKANEAAFRMAKSLGVPKKEVKDYFTSQDKTSIVNEVVAEALEHSGFDSRRVRALEAEIARLEAQVNKLSQR